MPRPEAVAAGGVPAQDGRTAARRWMAAKVAVTAAILLVLFWQVDAGELGRVLRHSLGGFLLLALVANSLLLVTSTWKWRQLLRAVGMDRGFGWLFRLYSIGFFFSAFLPGTVGGDVVRWHVASDARELRLRVGATIVAERITGLVALILLCAALVAWDPRFATAPSLALIAGAAAAIGAAIWLGYSAGLARLLERLARGRAAWLMSPVRKLHRALADVPARALLASVAWSLPFYASAGLLFFLIGRACGADVSFLEVATGQMLICLLTLIPISLGGLGLSQVGDVYLLGLVGVDAPTALAMSLLRTAIHYAYAGLGAVFFVGWRGRPSVAELRSMPREAPSAGAGAGAGGA